MFSPAVVTGMGFNLCVQDIWNSQRLARLELATCDSGGGVHLWQLDLPPASDSKTRVVRPVA